QRRVASARPARTQGRHQAHPWLRARHRDQTSPVPEMRARTERSAMSRKRRKKTEAHAEAPVEERYKPKAGPGSVFVEEFVSAKTGREKRARNIGEHPLTLAHARGKISDDQFAAGEEVRRLYELRGLSGRDSTTMTTGGGSGSRLPFTQTQVDAIRRLDHIRAKLKDRDW